MRLIQITGTAISAVVLVACASHSKYSPAVQAAHRAEDEKAHAEKDAREARLDAEKARRDAEKARDDARQAVEAQREAEDNARWATLKAAEAERHAARAKQGRSSVGVTERQPEPSGQVGGARISVLFAQNSTDLSPEAKASLEGVVRAVGDRKTTLHFVIHGFGDDAGTDARNVRLSQKRAARVADYLETKGISAGQIHATGTAPSRGAGKDLKTGEGAPWRRVDVIVEQARSAREGAHESASSSQEGRSVTNSRPLWAAG